MLLANPVYRDYLAGLAKSHPLPVTGVILGMIRSGETSTHPDMVVHMVRLFKSEDGEEPAEDREALKSGLAFDIEDILLMLPPGIVVLGTFVVCGQEDVAQDAVAWDRVKLIYRVLRKLCVDSPPQKHFILSHNPTTSKTTCKQMLGVKSQLDKNDLKPAAIEFKETTEYQLVQLNAQFTLTRNTFLRKSDWVSGDRGHMDATRLRDKLTAGLESSLNNTLIAFNGEIPTPKQKVRDVAVVQQDSAGGDRQERAPVLVEIYEKNVPHPEDADCQRSGDVLQLRGCVASRLYVFLDDPIELAESLLRKDLIRSIMQRIDTAMTNQQSEDNKGKVIALENMDRLGRRIYFTIQPSNIQLFDYLTADESEDELRERINSKLDIDVEVTDIYFDVEEEGFGAAGGDTDIDTIGKGSGPGETTSAATAGGVTSQLGSRKYLPLIARFLLVAAVAVLLPLIFSKKEDKK